MYPAFRYAEMMRLSMQMSLMAYEAQTVMTLRLLGLMGVLPARADENSRMMAEKVSAYGTSAQSSARAMVQGRPADEVAMAALRPIRRKTRSNAVRLVADATAKE